MRLIDADVLLKHLTNCIETTKGLYRSVCVAIKCFVEQMPTVDAVILPCKVGDTVLVLGDRFPAEIEEVRITKYGVFFVYVEYDRSYELTEVWDDGEFQESDIGKTVFLTLDEYESALAKMYGDSK